MSIQVLMPALSPTMTEGKLAKWHVKVGDAVKSGQVICEIETDKATMEVEAVDEGRIGQILVEEGTEGVGARAVALLLDGVAERNAVRRRAGRQCHLDLRYRGGIEARAQLGQQVQHFRRRIGLHRVEDAGFRQRPGERQIVFTNDVEIDDEARAFRPRGGKIVKNALGRHKTDPLPSLLPTGFRAGDAMEAPNPRRFL